MEGDSAGTGATRSLYFLSDRSGVFKPNKNGKPVASIYEVLMAIIYESILGSDIVPQHGVVIKQVGADREIVGVCVSMIEGLKPFPNTVPEFDALMRIPGNMERFAKILLVSYLMGEDDLHRGNLVVNKHHQIMRIDFDLSMINLALYYHAEERGNFISAWFGVNSGASLHYSKWIEQPCVNEMEYHAFPNLFISQPFYHPTFYRGLVSDGAAVKSGAYWDFEVTQKVQSLSNDHQFKSAKEMLAAQIVRGDFSLFINRYQDNVIRAVQAMVAMDYIAVKRMSACIMRQYAQSLDILARILQQKLCATLSVDYQVFPSITEVINSSITLLLGYISNPCSTHNEKEMAAKVIWFLKRYIPSPKVVEQFLLQLATGKVLWGMISRIVCSLAEINYNWSLLSEGEAKNIFAAIKVADVVSIVVTDSISQSLPILISDTIAQLYRIDQRCSIVLSLLDVLRYHFPSARLIGQYLEMPNLSAEARGILFPLQMQLVKMYIPSIEYTDDFAKQSVYRYEVGSDDILIAGEVESDSECSELLSRRDSLESLPYEQIKRSCYHGSESVSAVDSDYNPDSLPSSGYSSGYDSDDEETVGRDVDGA